jgi:hypothetical protein
MPFVECQLYNGIWQGGAVGPGGPEKPLPIRLGLTRAHAGCLWRKEKLCGGERLLSQTLLVGQDDEVHAFRLGIVAPERRNYAGEKAC